MGTRGPDAALMNWCKALKSDNEKFDNSVRRNKTTVSHLESVPTLTLEDCQVSSRTADDRMYKKIRGLTQAQPRGLTFVTADGELVHVVRGLQKFGDESDIDHFFLSGAWKKVTHLVFTEKANGENAKVGAMRINGQLVWLVASKNVTLAVTDARFMQDLRHTAYESTRFSFTRKIAEQWFNILTHITPESRARVADYLVGHKVTLIGEAFFKDSQHIVDMSDLDKKEADGQFVHRLQFYAMADPRPEEMGLTHVSVVDGHKLMRSWVLTLHMRQGLDVVPNVSVAAIDTPEQAEQERAARERINSEGAVVYGLDASGTVVCIYKWKNVQYVYWRAVRELMRAKASLARMKRRLSTEMYLDHPNVTAFIQEATEFYSWCCYESEVSKTYDYSLVFSTWYDRHNTFKSVPQALRKQGVLQAVEWMSGRGGSGGDHLQIAFVAIPGMGKSTLARALAVLLGLPWINQDALGGDAKAYHKALAETTAGPDTTGVICDKSHHKPQVRQAMLDALGHIMQLVYIVIKHPDDPETSLKSTVQLARQRIVEREFGHKSLFKGPSLSQAMAMFEKDWVPLSDQEIKNASLVIQVSALLSLEEALNHIVYELDRPGLLKRDKPLPEEMASAISQAKEYEENLNKENMKHAITLYHKIQLDGESERRVREVTRPLLSKHCGGMEQKTEFHVTLLFMKDTPTQEQLDMDEKLKELEGYEVSFVGTLIGHNDRVAALLLDQNSVAVPHDGLMHISLALARLKDGKTVPPSEAGPMLLGAHQSIDVGRLQLKGHVMREWKLDPKAIPKRPHFGGKGVHANKGDDRHKSETNDKEKGKGAETYKPDWEKRTYEGGISPPTHRKGDRHKNSSTHAASSSVGRRHTVQEVHPAGNGNGAASSSTVAVKQATGVPAQTVTVTRVQSAGVVGGRGGARGGGASNSGGGASASGRGRGMTVHSRDLGVGGRGGGAGRGAGAGSGSSEREEFPSLATAAQQGKKPGPRK